jgi:hypothetical protein
MMTMTVSRARTAKPLLQTQVTAGRFLAAQEAMMQTNALVSSPRAERDFSPPTIPR